MGNEVDQDDVESLVKFHKRGLTTEDLQELDSFIEHGSWGGGKDPRLLSSSFSNSEESLYLHQA